MQPIRIFVLLCMDGLSSSVNVQLLVTRPKVCFLLTEPICSFCTEAEVNLHVAVHIEATYIPLKAISVKEAEINVYKTKTLLNAKRPSQ